MQMIKARNLLFAFPFVDQSNFALGAAARYSGSNSNT
jgi:hypothetical protein